ncbi:hypothetical protein [Alteromonas gracilis]|uniref:Glycosyltransferase n=1 Tax=Alteromonas gracilis TaxID=1479524 RepID=A0ABX5CNK1_9ALTE|nr:hypothetical protein [Alteromonas gracilis]PRO68457.1 hypothetical protein C6Y39_12480 [Alteromonas gracilis]
MIVKTAILCVYYVPEDMEWVFYKQLEQIRKNSQNYIIYAAFIKGSDKVYNALKQSDDVKLCKVHAENNHPSKQHSMALTQLMQYAISDEVDAVVTLDVDSFPISDKWLDSMYLLASSSDGVCAVHRVENGDKFLPHPSGCLLLTQFIKDFPFEFYPDNLDDLDDKFINETEQRPDSGVGLGRVLWEHDLSWSQIKRTNKQDLHYLMAGVYGDIIFHLGAGSRSPLFAKEVNNSKTLRLIQSIENLPLLWRVHNKLKKYIENRLIKQNSKVVRRIELELKNNAEDFFIFLKTN